MANTERVLTLSLLVTSLVLSLLTLSLLWSWFYGC
jgi:hypothetical protein